MSFALQPTDARIAVVGLGYVGLPLALAFGREFDTIGYDIDRERIAELVRGHDRHGETPTDAFAQAPRARFTDDGKDLAGCNVFVIAVPTPVTPHKWPDLTPLIAASESIAPYLRAGTLVIYESTVYPGATEEVCVPVLQRVSGLRCNEDFFVGYSPERINPGDRTRRLGDIVKVTSGSTPEAADFVDALYRRIVPAGTHRAPSIRVAEAAKAVENIQRDVNIALMNELALIFQKLEIDTGAVLAAAGSKWNFLPFRPGLVGGHCIGVDPYYLIHKAQEVNHYPELIAAARRVNESMAAHVTQQVLRLMELKGIALAGSRILLLGATFKENCADLRNSRVREIVEALLTYAAHVDVHDPWADAAACRFEIGMDPIDTPQPNTYDAIIIAVGHDQFRAMGAVAIRALGKPTAVLFDVKHLLEANQVDGRL